MYHQIGSLIQGCRLPIDDHEPGPVFLGEGRKSRCRKDDQRLARHQKEVARRRQLLRPAHGLIRHGLSEGNGGRFEDSPTDPTVGRIAVRLETSSHPVEFMAETASQAFGIGAIAVQLDDLIRREAGCLMKPIDVLCDDGRHTTGRDEGCEAKVAHAWTCIAIEIVHGEFPPPSLPACFRTMLEKLEGNRLVAHPGAVGRAEIGDAALCRDPGPGKARNNTSVLNHVL